MRKHRFPAFIFILACLFTTRTQAQLAPNFNDEMNAIVKENISNLKGEQKEKQSWATIYHVKLKLTGFTVTYAESGYGNDLSAKYNQPGSMELMDQVYKKLNEKNFAVADSKIDAGILGKGLFASDLKRKITIKSTVAAQWRANITLSKDDKIQIVFIKE